MTAIRACNCQRAHCERRDLPWRRTEANIPFEDGESIQNLILSLGYDDFKSNGGYKESQGQK